MMGRSGSRNVRNIRLLVYFEGGRFKGFFYGLNIGGIWRKFLFE